MATKAEPYVPPPDPDFKQLAQNAYAAWHRDRPELVAFDTETTGLTFHDTAFCVTVAWRTAHGIEAHYIELEKYRPGLGYCQDILHGARTLVGHNIKFDLQKVILAGVLDRVLDRVPAIHDTEALAHLDNEHRTKGLKDLMVSVLGWVDNVEVPIKSGPNAGQVKLVPRETHELGKAKEWAKKKYGLASVKDVGYHLLPRGVLAPYAVTDARATLELYERLRPEIARYDDLWELYEQEMELTLVLLDMETAGMATDDAYVAEQVKAYAKRVVVHELRIEQIVGKPVGKDVKGGEFNPQSSTQLKEFFSERGHVHASYDKEVLPTIAHPLAPAILELRSDAKLLNTYFRAMQDESRNGILNPNFRQHGTVTGRMSSGKQEG